MYEYYITPDEYKFAARNGISPRTLEVRVRTLGWPKKRAMTEPPKKKKTIIPKRYVKLAEQNGISYSTLRYRVNIRGWSYEKAATTPTQKKQRKKSDYPQTYPDDILRLLEKNRIKYNTFRYRIRNGWGLHKAATTPPMTKKEIGILSQKKRKKYRTLKNSVGQ